MRCTNLHKLPGFSASLKHPTIRGKRRVRGVGFSTSKLENLEKRQLLSAPEIGNISEVSVPLGQALQLPVASNDSSQVTWTSSRSDSDISLRYRSASNPFIELDVTGYGKLVFQLFADVAPESTRRITGLVDSGFYNGIRFHRVINSPTPFIIQTGDPKTRQPHNSLTNIWGTGGPGFTFADEFNRDASFTGNGQLALANTSTRDTNGSQFFVTSGQQRSLDFNHTIFGQLVRGFDVQRRIQAAQTNSESRPVSDITIRSARTISNRTDAVLQIKGERLGTSDVTVTARDTSGNTSTRTFRVRVVPNLVNSPPILDRVNVLRTNVNQPITVELSGFDREGDLLDTAVQWVGNSGDNATGVRVGQTNSFLITPRADYRGAIRLMIGIKELGSVRRGNVTINPNNINEDPFRIFDTQVVTIVVGDQNLTASGRTFAVINGQPTDGTPLATFTAFPSTNPGSYSARVDWGDGVVTDGLISRADDGTFQVRGQHVYSREADLPVTITVTGDRGATATVVSTADVNPLHKLTGTTLEVFGSDSTDRIEIVDARSSTQLVLRHNSRTFTFNRSAVSQIHIRAFAGNDVVTAVQGMPALLIEGGEGNDTITGSSNADSIYGNAGADLLSGSGGRNLIDGGSSNDRIFGGNARDTLLGKDGNDRVYGRGGDDRLEGGKGDDQLFGEDGNDTLFGNEGNDLLRGGNGNDLLQGDNLTSPGRDTLDGGAGTDSALRDSLDSVLDSETFRVL